MILFVCSQGKIRSRTAEVLALMGGLQARSCGTDDDAWAALNTTVLWKADAVVCMEQAHAKRVREFMASEGKPVVSLGIPDEYDPFDPELIDLLITTTHMRLGDSTVSSAMARGRDVMLVNRIYLS